MGTAHCLHSLTSLSADYALADNNYIRRGDLLLAQTDKQRPSLVLGADIGHGMAS